MDSPLPSLYLYICLCVCVCDLQHSIVVGHVYMNSYCLNGDLNVPVCAQLKLFHKHSNKPPGSTRGTECLDYVGDCWFLKYSSTE